MTDALALTGRCLLATLLILGALQKLTDPSGAMGLLADWGLPPFLVYPALAFNAFAGAALLAGWHTRPIALLLMLAAFGPGRYSIDAR